MNSIFILIANVRFISFLALVFGVIHFYILFLVMGYEYYGRLPVSLYGIIYIGLLWLWAYIAENSNSKIGVFVGYAGIYMLFILPVFSIIELLVALE